jgi:hypothetical protein
MSNMTPWEWLINGSVLRAGYETYNQAFAVSGIQNWPIGILFIVFQVLLYIASRNIVLHFVVSLIAYFLLFAYIPVIIKGIITTVLVLELGGIIYAWVVKR